MESMSMKLARQSVNLSQEEMAKKLGISLSAYRRYEENPQLMRMREYLKFCRTTNCDITKIKM